MSSMQRPTIDLAQAHNSSTLSDTLPDISDALPWREWDEGLAESAKLKIPLFVFAEPAWTNSAQRVALRLQQDQALRETILAGFVPVLLSPVERPDLIARWRRVATYLVGNVGPPLMMCLTHEGEPFLSYTTMAIEGDPTYPSLASLLASIAEAYAIDPAPFITDADMIATAPVPDNTSLDLTNGGIDEIPRRPPVSAMWSALEAADSGDLTADRERWLLTTLRKMASGGLYDHLDRGFFRCTREATWIVPHFEKPIPLNAALAAIYARAGTLFNDASWLDLSARTASFCAAALADGVDVIGSNTAYYTWTSKEFLDNLDPTLVQVITLHYGIMPVDLRQSLRRVVEIEHMDRYSHENAEVLRTRLIRARAQLRSVRQRRPSPELISLPVLAWRAETIRWLLITSSYLDSLDSGPALEALSALVEGRLEAGIGYRRTSGLWLEDQAALFGALVTAARVHSDETWRDLASDLATMIDHAWRVEGGWRDQPSSDRPSNATVDGMIPAAIPTLESALAELGYLSDRDNRQA
jgi:uncharacterized protein